MSVVHIDPMLQVETTCGSLLYELQVFTILPLQVDQSIFLLYLFHFFFLNLLIGYLCLDVCSQYTLDFVIKTDNMG